MLLATMLMTAETLRVSHEPIVLDYSPQVPRCQEDGLVLGKGNFHADGYWDYYACEPFDNPYGDVASEVREPWYNDGFRAGYKAGYAQAEVEGVSP